MNRLSVFKNIIAASGVIMLLLQGCSTINTIVKEGIKEPHLSVDKVDVTGFDFKNIDLLFDINIENPNSLGVKLNGFDYDFGINNNSFLVGDNAEGLEIVANGEHTVQIPLSVSYADLFNTVKSVQKEDQSSYQLKAGFLFDVPVLGSIRVPVSKNGNLPIVKIPSIRLGSLKLKKLNLTGADLEVAVNIDNPNAFGLDLQKMVYNLDINGSNWLSGVTTEALQISEKSKSALTLPVSLNFLELGSSVYQIVSGGEELAYRFSGNVDLGSTLPMLPKANLDFDKSGNIPVIK